MGMLIVWAFAAPILRYVQASDIWAVGVALGVVIYAGYWAMIYFDSRDGKAMLIVALLFAIFAVYLTAPMLDHAFADSAANDKRCLAIQRDMLSARPRRSDGPDLFQALSCRPQGEGSVYAPPVKPRGM